MARVPTRLQAQLATKELVRVVRLVEALDALQVRRQQGDRIDRRRHCRA
jgi:hypothetical protein